MSDEGSAGRKAPVNVAGRAGRRTSRMALLLAVAAVVLALDIVTKVLVVAFLRPADPVWLIGDVVSLRLIRNPGAAFSMATGETWILTVVAIAIVVAILKFGRRLRSPWWALGFGLVLGGALGNLVDRIFRAPGPMRGYVVDFISVGWWPVFNVADSGIVCGAILLAALAVFGVEPDGTRRGRSEASRTQDGAGEPGTHDSAEDEEMDAK